MVVSRQSLLASVGLIDKVIEVWCKGPRELFVQLFPRSLTVGLRHVQVRWNKILARNVEIFADGGKRSKKVLAVHCEHLVDACDPLSLHVELFEAANEHLGEEHIHGTHRQREVGAWKQVGAAIRVG